MNEKDKTSKNDADLRSETQLRILDAAGEIFAESGYDHTTIRAICQRAAVNVAAINYHFGGKKNLYLAVLKHSRAMAFEKYPFDPADVSAGTPEARIRDFVTSLLFRLLGEGEGTRFARLIARELIRPTEGLGMVAEETMKPFYAFLSGVIREFFPAPPPEMTVNLCCLSIAGQIFHLYMARHPIQLILDRDDYTREEIEMVAEHITRFSVYAIRQIARNTAAQDQGECV